MMDFEASEVQSVSDPPCSSKQMTDPPGYRVSLSNMFGASAETTLVRTNSSSLVDTRKLSQLAENFGGYLFDTPHRMVSWSRTNSDILSQPDYEAGDIKTSHTESSSSADEAREHVGKRSLAGVVTTKGSNNIQSEHLGESRQYWRDIILGVNDGLVSTFLLIAGVTGASLSTRDVLLTAIAGTIAGAISMAAGEYMATKTQEEVFDGEIKVERRHISQYREEELEELMECFKLIGISSSENSDKEEVEDLQRRLRAFYRQRDDAHLSAHIALEFGVLDSEKRSPYIAGAASFFLFVFGALPSVFPFLVIKNASTAMLLAGILTTLGLLLVGGIKTWATKGKLWTAVTENVIVSAGGGAIAYAVGFAFELMLRDADP